MNEGMKLFAVFAVTLMAIGGMAFITADDSDAALGTYTGGSNQSSASNPYTGIDVNIATFADNFGSGSTIYITTGASVHFEQTRGQGYPTIDSRPSWLSYTSATTAQGSHWDGTAPSSTGTHTLEIQETAWSRYNVTISVVQNTIAPTGITISGSTSGDIGDRITLTASVSPSNATNKNVTWSIESGSSNASISSSGTSCTVSLTREGSVTIRATAQGNSSVYDTHTIEIIDPVTLVTSVSIDGPTDVFVGDSESYTVSVSPSGATDKSIEWRLSNTSRAEITSSSDTSCTVEFKSSGTVTLYADAQDGSGESDSFRIYIEDPIQLVTSVSITGSSTVDVGSSITLGVSVSPSDATDDSITWTISSGGSYATITSSNDSSCTIRGTAAGTVVVRATAQDDSGKYDTHTITVQKANEQFNLNFSYSPGSPGPQNQSWTVRQDTYTYTIPTTIPLRNDGYIFVQWNGSDGENYNPGDRITLQPGTTTLTAEWELVQYTSYLYYSADGATNVPETDSYTGSETTDHTFTIDSTVPTRSGYVFLYWSCDGQSYDPGETISVPYNSSKTLTAMWETAQLDITSSPSTTGIVEGDTFSYRVTTNIEGCTVQVSGADWLTVSDSNLVSGTPTENGQFEITITVTKAGGYVSDTQQFTITVYSGIGFDSEPGAEGFYTYMLD